MARPSRLCHRANCLKTNMEGTSCNDDARWASVRRILRVPSPKNPRYFPFFPDYPQFSPFHPDEPLLCIAFERGSLLARLIESNGSRTVNAGVLFAAWKIVPALKSMALGLSGMFF